MAKVRKRGNTYQIDYFDPNGRRVRKSFKKKKDAEAELGKRVSLIAEGRYLDVKKEYKTTLQDLIKKYRENHSEQRSFYNSKKVSIEYIKKYFGEKNLLSSIRFVDVETFRNTIRRRPGFNGTKLSDATVNRIMSCLHHLFTKAVEWEMAERSPFSNGKSLWLKENNERLRFLNEDEIKALLDKCPPYLHNIVKCAINTGMRKGEIVQLKWSQIRNGFIYLQKTKTKEPRQIPINAALEHTFNQIRKENHLKSAHVFLYRGKPIERPRSAFNKAKHRAGIYDFRFHDLRHTFASQLIMRGGSLKEVQELLGHKNINMTMRYAHLSQEHKKRAVNLLNDLTGSNEKTTCHKTVTKLKAAV